eukprot:31023-Pelagococcus_subviridis.AAC.4
MLHGSRAEPERAEREAGDRAEEEDDVHGDAGVVHETHGQSRERGEEDAEEVDGHASRARGQRSSRFFRDAVAVAVAVAAAAAAAARRHQRRGLLVLISGRVLRVARGDELDRRRTTTVAVVAVRAHRGSDDARSGCRTFLRSCSCSDSDQS